MIARPPRADAAAKFAADGGASVSKERLLVMLYERLERDLQSALVAIREGRWEPAHVALVHAQEIVSELDVSLDHDVWDGAQALSSVYRYLMDRLITANVRKDPAAVEDCLRVVGPLAETWTTAWKSVSSAPVPAPAPPTLGRPEPGAAPAPSLNVVG